MDLRRRAWCATWTLGATANALAAPVASPACRVVGSGDPPYRLFLPQGRVGGLYFELLQAAAERAGWPLRFDEMPQTRALLLLHHGEADLMVGPLRQPDRERYLVYSRITLPAEDKVVYTLGRPVQHLDDLNGLNVGVQRGKRYGASFDALRHVHRVELPDYGVALRMLALGRLDAVVAPEREADLVRAQLDLGSVHKQALRLAGAPPHLVVSQRSRWRPRLAELEQGFDAIRQDGTWARILARY